MWVCVPSKKIILYHLLDVNKIAYICLNYMPSLLYACIFFTFVIPLESDLNGTIAWRIEEILNHFSLFGASQNLFSIKLKKEKKRKKKSRKKSFRVPLNVVREHSNLSLSFSLPLPLILFETIYIIKLWLDEPKFII